MSITVDVLHCGDVNLDVSALFQDMTPEPFPHIKGMSMSMLRFMRPAKYHIDYPVLCFLIHHPKGTILFDTSWDKLVRTDPLKSLGLLGSTVDKPSLPAGQAVDEQIEAMGIQPSDLDYVILSHLHIDHAGGLKSVAGAKHILVTREELEHANTDKQYNHDMWKGVPMETVQWTGKLGPFQKSMDLFGDGTIQLIYLPGHTPGHMGIRIQAGEKYLILAGDCGYARRSWQDMIYPGLIKNYETMHASLSYLREASRDPNCIDIICDHETDVWRKSYEISE